MIKKILLSLSILLSMPSQASFISDVPNTTKVKITQPNKAEYEVYETTIPEYEYKYIRSPLGDVLIKNQKSGWYEVAMYYEMFGNVDLVSTGRKYKPVKGLDPKRINMNIWPQDIQRLAYLKKLNDE